MPGQTNQGRQRVCTGKSKDFMVHQTGYHQNRTHRFLMHTGISSVAWVSLTSPIQPPRLLIFVPHTLPHFPSQVLTLSLLAAMAWFSVDPSRARFLHLSLNSQPASPAMPYWQLPLIDNSVWAVAKQMRRCPLAQSNVLLVTPLTMWYLHKTERAHRTQHRQDEGAMDATHTGGRNKEKHCTAGEGGW